MNKERPYRDQAEKLRQKIDRVTFEEGQMVEREELPPRSRVHGQKRKKNKWKLKYPVIRLLVLFFILLPITIFSIYSSILKEPVGDTRKTAGESSDGFEVIDIEQQEPQDTVETEQDREQNSSTGDVPGESQEIQSGEQSSFENSSSSPQETSPVSIDSIVSETKSESNDIIYHKVQHGETIFKISLKYYHSKGGIETIKEANDLTTNEIKVGQILTIPLTK